MNLQIFGLGITGQALKHWFLTKTDHQVFEYDPPKNLLQLGKNIECSFVCVPADTRQDRSQDLSLLESVLEIAVPPVFIRSTVRPGTCDFLAEKFSKEVFAMPEFLTERRNLKDMERLDILCGDQNNYRSILQTLFPGKRIRSVTNKEAEYAKYVHNVFAAVKINFFNNIRHICDFEKIDYDRVLEGIFLSGFINEEHTKVPGPDGLYGYGGKCLPKDLAVFLGLVETFISELPTSSLFSNVLHCTEAQNRYFRNQE